MTDAQVGWCHRWRFVAALVLFAGASVILVGIYLDARNGGLDLARVAVIVAFTTLAVYLWGVVRRRWQRLLLYSQLKGLR